MSIIEISKIIKPIQASDGAGVKLKRNSKTSSISLKPAPDILKSISKLNVGKIIAFAFSINFMCRNTNNRSIF